MSPSHGILASEKFVPPSQMVDWGGVEVPVGDGCGEVCGVPYVTWVEELECHVVFGPKYVVTGISQCSC